MADGEISSSSPLLNACAVVQLLASIRYGNLASRGRVRGKTTQTIWVLHKIVPFGYFARDDVKQPLRYSPPLTCTSYREYLGEESILMSGRNFSASVSITSCVVAVLDTRMHLVAKFPATRSWK